MTDGRDHSESWRHTTRGILERLAEGDVDGNGTLDFGDAVESLGNRGFGMLLLIAVILAAIPIPGLAGGVSGPIVILTGFQLLMGRKRPWLPKFLLRRRISADFLVKARDILVPKLARIEKLVRPRNAPLFDRFAWNAVTGLLLVLLGVLLLLPILFTNYLFALLIFLFVVALIERDGNLLLISWAAGALTIAIFGIASGSLVAAASDLLQKFGML